jgi:hypothetical protein
MEIRVARARRSGVEIKKQREGIKQAAHEDERPR